jgi:V8-like Glu-specific endopeptidase
MIKHFKNRVLILVLLVVFVSCSENLQNIDPDLPEGLVNSTDPKFDKRLMAIGQFVGPMFCTATYVEVPSQTLDSPAYIITNGHCANDFFEDNPIYIDKSISAQVIFKNIEGIPENQHVIFNTKKIAYATMKGTDLAIIELDHTNRELKKAGILPLKIASKSAEKGTLVHAYGYPLYLGQLGLRGSKGELGGSSMVAEFLWIWKDFYSVFMKDIASGSSGSPVFENLSTGVWGMINTTTIGATGTCELGAPCEFAQTIAPSIKPETTYLFDIRNIRTSFNSKGIFDINSNTSVLEKPAGFTVSLESGKRNFGMKDLEEKKLIFTSSSFQTTSYRLDAFENYDWNNSAGFLPMTNEFESVNFPEKESFYVLTLQSDGNKNRLTFKMDFTAPDFSLIQLNQSKVTDGLFISPVFIYPELVGFRWKIGPLATCDCSDTSDFQLFTRNAEFVGNNELPVKVCVIGSDLAGNQSKVKEFILNK